MSKQSRYNDACLCHLIHRMVENINWDNVHYNALQTLCATKKTMKVKESTGNTTTSFSYLVFLEFHLWHMEVPRLGIELELQLPAYTTATATGI